MTFTRLVFSVLIVLEESHESELDETLISSEYCEPLLELEAHVPAWAGDPEAGLVLVGKHQLKAPVLAYKRAFEGVRPDFAALRHHVCEPEDIAFEKPVEIIPAHPVPGGAICYCVRIEAWI